MPNIIVKVPAGAFDAAGCERLGKGITAVAKQVEQIGDDPRHEFTTWVVIEEVKAGHFFAGGNDPLSRVIPVIVLFYVPEGVIGEAGRVDAVRLIQAA
jgi:phenylpyruvate tautomerase PptA (4-oxalocrotonate tautomerase family)